MFGRLEWLVVNTCKSFFFLFRFWNSLMFKWIIFLKKKNDILNRWTIKNMYVKTIKSKWIMNLCSLKDSHDFYNS